MGTGKPIQIVVQFPKSREGAQALAERVSQAHAALLADTLRRLDCPPEQKLDLLHRVAAHRSAKSGPESGQPCPPAISDHPK